jgi:hypothetical protein
MKVKRPLARTPWLRASLAAPAAVLVASCGSSSGHETSPPPDSGTQDGAMRSRPDAALDAAVDGRAPKDAAPDSPKLVNGDVCGAPSGSVAWMDSISATSSTLTLSDVVFGPTSDVVVADQSGASYEQHRWDETGSPVSVHQDALGSYAGPFSASNLFVDASNNLFYGTLMTGLADGTSSGAELTFTRLGPNGTVLSTDPHMASMSTSKGAPTVLVFDAGGDSGGGLHSAFTLGGPQYFTPGVYCYGSDGSFSGISAPAVTATMGARDFEWPNAAVGLYVAKRVTSSLNLGCGSLTVPSAGATVLAQLDTDGNCIWNKLLTLPTETVLANDFRLGADGSLAMAVVYDGTIDFGGGTLTSQGTSSIAVAHFDSKGNVLFSNTFGGAGSSSTMGSLGVNADGALMLSAGYKGSVDLGAGALPKGDDTFVAVFDTTGSLKWAKTVTVGTTGKLVAAIGACGVAVATNSPSVNLGAGPLSKPSMPSSSGPPSIGVAALGL